MINQARWEQFAIYEQMGHIASELTRARLASERADKSINQQSLLRVIEMLDLMRIDQRHFAHLKELGRFKEIVADLYALTNNFTVSLKSLEEYSLGFLKLR